MRADECELLPPQGELRIVGATLEERGRRAIVEHATAEVVVLKLDSVAGRRWLGLTEQAGCCDGLFAFFEPSRVRVVLVELKGGHVEEGVRQIVSAYSACRRKVSRCATEITWRGRVVCRSAAPQRRWQRHVHADSGLEVKLKVGSRFDVQADRCL